MRKALLLPLFLVLLLMGCNKKSPTPQPEFAADIRMVTPFAPDTPTMNGKLYMSKGRLRVELGSMVDVYTVAQKRGWRMLTKSKKYINIGEKQVSTYLPHMTNGSPCPTAEQPLACKMVGKENIEGRSATKWELVNQHGVRVYLWTDDELQVAIKWQIENVTYELTAIHDGLVADSMFELPPGYSRLEGAFADYISKYCC